MNHSRPLSLLAVAGVLVPGLASAALTGYWAFDETSGTTAANDVGGGTDATLAGGAAFFDDPDRGRVIAFDGAGYADAGTNQLLTVGNDYSLAFWSKNQEAALESNNVIVGNRYMDSGTTSFTPLEFNKFTTRQFEYRPNNVVENLDYAPAALDTWIHNVVVKEGNNLRLIQNGQPVASRTITASFNNAQPLFFGGNGSAENWTGRLDDAATWNSPLTAHEAVALANGYATPATVAAAPASGAPVFSDSFSGGTVDAGKWTQTNRGLEQNGPAGYDSPSQSGGELTLGGTASQSFWYGSSLESVAAFDSSLATSVTVDRVSLAGSGTAYRSSLWILGDDDHYIHFSHNVGESGWSYNAKDGTGIGNQNPTGGGFNLTMLDAFDMDLGNHEMRIDLLPGNAPGELSFLLYFDGEFVGSQAFSDFTDDFRVVLTGQARAAGDTVSAVFDNLTVTVPEPSITLLFGLGFFGAVLRRRR